MSRKLVIQQFLTLDGVMQAPGAKDEDTRNGFAFGGWQIPFFDESIVEFILTRYAATDTLLFGRLTYETFAAYWPNETDPNNPFAAAMNNFTKYVVTSQPIDLSWKTSYRIEGNIVQEIAKLKAQPGKDITVLGSGVLSQTLISHGLVDEYALMVAPLVLGTGTRLFRDGIPRQALTLASATTSKTGVALLTYRSKPGTVEE